MHGTAAVHIVERPAAPLLACISARGIRRNAISTSALSFGERPETYSIFKIRIDIGNFAQKSHNMTFMSFFSLSMTHRKLRAV